MSKHYYVATFFVALICISMVLGVGSCTTSNLAEVQQIDTSFMVKVRLYQDSVRNDTLVTQAMKARLDTLFDKWDEAFVRQQKSVYKAQETLNLNLTIWLSIIAAICTILPIVLAMNQSNNLREQLDSYSDELDRKKTKFQEGMDESFEKIKGQKGEVERQVKNYQSEICHTEVITLLNMLSQNLALLCNLQEIENKENPILTSPELVKTIIASFKENVVKCQAKFNDKKDYLEGTSINSIQNALMSTLCSIRDMAYLYENIFNGANLLKIQRLRDNISFYIIEKIPTFQSSTVDDVEETFGLILESSKALDKIFSILEN